LDAFEHLISRLLLREGYWVETAVKVELTKEDKRRLENPSMPRQELDIVPYDAKRNVLLVVECKSYLDSGGVHVEAFNGKSDSQASQ